MTKIRALLFDPVYNYGRIEFKPANDEAKLAAKLARKTHLNKVDLETLAAMGFRVSFTVTDLSLV